LPPIERTIIVQAPVDRVYQWWARWENLPTILPRIQQVKKTGPFSTHWWAEAADGRPLEWDAAIVLDLPQRQLEWESRTGPLAHKGHVDFEALAGDRTRLKLTMTPPPNGEAFRSEDLDIALDRFKDLIEAASPPPAPLPVAYPYRDLFYRAMSAAAGVLLVAALAWSLVSLIEVWMIMLGALLTAATLSPAVAWLTRLRIPRAIAVLLTFGAVLAGTSVLLIVLIPSIMGQGQELAARIPGYAAEVQTLLSKWHTTHPAIPEGTQVTGYVADQASAMLANAFSLTTRFIWLLVVFLSIMFLSLFMLLDGSRLQEAILRLMPIPQKAQVPALLHTVQERLGRYMLGIVFICALTGVITWGALALMGVPYALLIGAFTTLMQVIPFVGPLFGGGLAALVGLSKSPETAIWTLVVYAAIQQVVGQFLFPVIMGRTIGMHPVWIMVALLIGGTLYGLVGAFMAIPIAITLSIMMECYYFPWAEAKAEEGAAPTTPVV
jgi:predicted PurR-regulated permease PerM